MMGNYIEQSKSLFIQMQEQMQEQTKSMFGSSFPFVPGAAAPGADKTKK
jgi:polyhydroxyalkanoate synthesis regulator protein